MIVLFALSGIAMATVGGPVWMIVIYVQASARTNNEVKGALGEDDKSILLAFVRSGAAAHHRRIALKRAVQRGLLPGWGIGLVLLLASVLLSGRSHEKNRSSTARPSGEASPQR